MSDANPKKKARNVCRACVARKRSCDKSLPACGYCVSRNQRCSYDVKKRPPVYHPGKHFVALNSPESTGDHSPPQSVAESLHMLVLHWMERTALTIEKVADLYFNTFHVYLPIISPGSYRRDAKSSTEGAPLASDLAALHLAMLLSIFPLGDPNHRPSAPSQRALYTDAKSALAAAHASMDASIRLAQASLLIAMREYTASRPQAAYVSILTCLGIARVVGASTLPSRGISNSQFFSGDDLERENLTWAIAMVERLILCEVHDQVGLQPQTEYPSLDSRLPSDLETISGPDAQPATNIYARNHVTLSDPGTHYAGKFGKQVQVVHLLDQLLTIMRLPSGSEATKTEQLADLDTRAQLCLARVMEEDEWKETRLCVSAPQCIRLLFLLHNTLLDHLRNSDDHVDQQKVAMSLSGLDTICRMMMDIVDCHGAGKCNALPSCCFYNLQAAKTHVEQSVARGSSTHTSDVARLRKADEAFRKAWVF